MADGARADTRTTPPPPLLRVTGIVKRFGGFTALDGIDLTVRAGEIVGLIGPNGSGKTTLINVVSGLLSANAGEISLDGRSLTGLPAHRRSAAGIGRTFQIPKPFASLSVRQNLEVAARDGVDIDAVLADVELDRHAARPVSDLNSVSQKLLDLARALVTRPTLLLVDELACGLNPVELARVAERLRALAAAGIGLVVVEHLMSFIDSITDRVVVMNAGREIFGGRLRDAVQDRDVVEVFLGAPEPVAA